MDKLFYLVVEGFKNIWRHKMTAITAVFSLFISLYIIGLIATAGSNSYKLIQYFRSKYKIEIFFKPEVMALSAFFIVPIIPITGVGLIGVNFFS